MKELRKAPIAFAALALILAACGTATATPTAPAETPTPEITATATATAVPAAPTETSAATAMATATALATLTAASPTPTHKPTPTGLQKPPAPTNFTATAHGGGTIPCPSPDSALNCRQTDLAWQSTAAAGTWFKIYQAWTGEGGGTCASVQSEAAVVNQTPPNARTAQLFNGMATGGGGRCLWITAVNGAGESAQVAVTGQ